jgi:hypothetical protein
LLPAFVPLSQIWFVFVFSFWCWFWFGNAGKGWETHFTPLSVLTGDHLLWSYYCVHEFVKLVTSWNLNRLLILGDEYMEFDSFDRT